MHDSAIEGRAANNTASIYRNWVLFEIFLMFKRETIARGNTVELAIT
jgi:hypothetical protein